jgi:hypothetical protein
MSWAHYPLCIYGEALPDLFFHCPEHLEPGKLISDVIKSSTLNILGYTYPPLVCYIIRAPFLLLECIALCSLQI